MAATMALATSGRCPERSSIGGNSRCHAPERSIGDVLDTLIKTPPIAAEVFHDPDHSR